MSEANEKPTILDEDEFSGRNLVEEFIPVALNEHLKSPIRDLTSKHGSVPCALQKTEGKLSKESKTKTKVDIHRSKSAKDEEIRILQDKLTQVNAKYSKCQNSCLTLRQELNKAQKLLSREIGDNITVVRLLKHSGGWKGRAEQISQLQSKLLELQRRLNDSEKLSRCSSVSLEGSTLFRAKSMERGRKQVESLEKELRLTDTTLDSNKKKLEAAKARIKVLENELADSRRNFIILNDSKIHGDQLIDALNGRLRAMEDKYNEKELCYKNQIEKTCRERSALQNELYSSKLLIEQLRKKNLESEAELDRIRSGTNKLNRNTSKSSQKLHDISPSLAARSNSHQDPDEYITLGIAAEAERERLIEMVAILNRRLDKERADADHKSELFRREREKNFKLENKLQKMESERVTKPRVNSGYRSRSSSSLISSKCSINDDSLKYKLELTEEENLALKARLTTIQQEKSEDLTTYKQLIENTKKFFHEALRRV